MDHDFDRDRHQHNGVWFERVAPHSPHYVQCSPDVVPTFEPTKGNMMDVEKMSNEELRTQLGYIEGISDREDAVIRESMRRLRTSMHWLPMTEDAVFEGLADYLISVTLDDGTQDSLRAWHDGDNVRRPFITAAGNYRHSDITHYARITEPNK